MKTILIASGMALLLGAAPAAAQDKTLTISVYAFAQEHTYRAVRLGVVDTNPRARALYEREGFVAGRTLHLPGMQFLAGFGATTTMIRPV